MVLSRLNFSVSSPMLFSLSLFCSCWHCNYTLQCHNIRKLVATARHQQKRRDYLWVAKRAGYWFVCGGGVDPMNALDV